MRDRTLRRLSWRYRQHLIREETVARLLRKELDSLLAERMRIEDEVAELLRFSPAALHSYQDSTRTVGLLLDQGDLLTAITALRRARREAAILARARHAVARRDRARKALEPLLDRLRHPALLRLPTPSSLLALLVRLDGLLSAGEFRKVEFLASFLLREGEILSAMRGSAHVTAQELETRLTKIRAFGEDAGDGAIAVHALMADTGPGLQLRLIEELEMLALADRAPASRRGPAYEEEAWCRDLEEIALRAEKVAVALARWKRTDIVLESRSGKEENHG